MVAAGEKLYLSKDPDIKRYLDDRKKAVRKRNQGLISDVDKRYRCLTCGNKTGKEHPKTAYCFICDTDNWQLINKRK